MGMKQVVAEPEVQVAAQDWPWGQGGYALCSGEWAQGPLHSLARAVVRISSGVARDASASTHMCFEIPPSRWRWRAARLPRPLPTVFGIVARTYRRRYDT